MFFIVSCGKPIPEPWLKAVQLPFNHASGAKGDYFMPEIMGSGAASPARWQSWHFACKIGNASL